MKKWVCTVCGYVYEGENAPEKCPQCGVPASKFKEQASEGMAWACEHEVGVAQGSPEDIMMDLRANFEGECSEVGMYRLCQGLPTEKVILRLACTGPRLLSRKLSMLPSLLSC